MTRYSSVDEPLGTTMAVGARAPATIGATWSAPTAQATPRTIPAANTRRGLVVLGIRVSPRYATGRSVRLLSTAEARPGKFSLRPGHPHESPPVRAGRSRAGALAVSSNSRPMTVRQVAGGFAASN